MPTRRLMWLGITVAAASAVTHAQPTPANQPTQPRPTQPSSPAQPAPKQDQPKNPALTVSTPVIKLIDAGAEPRVQLRYAPAVGSTNTVNIRMSMSSQADFAGKVMQMSTPSVVIRMDQAVKEVAPGGDITYDATFTTMTTDGAGTNPMEAQLIKDALNAMQGMTARVVVSSRGETRSADFKLPETAAAAAPEMVDKIRTMLNQLVTPLPVESVGKGAKWEVSAVVDNLGLSMSQTTTATLQETKDATFTLDTAVTQRAEPQEMALPNLPPGYKLELVSLTGAGSGTYRGSTLAMAPVDSKMTLTSSEQVRATPPQSPPEEMKRSIKLETTIQSGQAAPTATTPQRSRSDQPTAAPAKK
ncbi:MAG TPA: hypothetical protein VD997_05180 [Phycisphaerales bacterium]|nr:hypothetical protein [Phycisphaerales bacterium]